MSRMSSRRAAASVFASGLLVLAAFAPDAARAGGVPEAVAATASLEATTTTDRLVIQYRKGTHGASASATAFERAALHRSAQDIAARHGLALQLVRVGGFDKHVLRLNRALAQAEALRLAQEIAAADSQVEYAEPDRVLQPMFTPNDTQYGQQWHYFEATGGIHLPAAWDKSTGSGVVVAVIDTGYRPHVDLAANVLPGYDMITSSTIAADGGGRDSDAKDPGDWVLAGGCGNGQPTSDQHSSWHGTHVAGTIAALSNNGSGVAGVAFNAKVVPVRALGRCGGYTSDIADGMIWAVGGTVSGLPGNGHPARVLNLSLGGSGACDTTTQNAINAARSRNAVVVVAAGNSNADAANFSPASCAGVITVAATNRSGGRAYYSNYGSVVELAAPGGDMRSSAANGILSTLNAGNTTPGADNVAWYQGTSMATPHVAGVAALMLAKNPALTPDQVISKIRASARAFPITCTGCGSGIVNASAAVDAAVASTATTTIAVVNEIESNNSSGTAQALAAPVTVNGSMASSSDVDYFKVNVGAGKTLTATLTPNSTSDYDLHLYNAAGTLLSSSVHGTGQVETASVSNTGSTTATFFVQVRFYSGASGSAGTYKLDVK